MRLLAHGTVLVGVLIAGCNEKSRCVEGASQACACADGRSGAQVCQANGTFGACACLPSTPRSPQVETKSSDLAAQLPPKIPKHDLLVGRWKSVDYDNVTVQFDDDGSFNLSGAVGTYARVNDDTISLRYTADAQDFTWRIKFDGDALSLGTTTQQFRYVRVKSPVLEVSATAPQDLSTVALGRPCDADFKLISGARALHSSRASKALQAAKVSAGLTSWKCQTSTS